MSIAKQTISQPTDQHLICQSTDCLLASGMVW